MTGPLQPDPAFSLAGAAAGRRLAYGLGKDILVYEADKGGNPAEVARLVTADRVTAVALSAGGEFAVATTDGGVEVFAVARGKRLYSDTVSGRGAGVTDDGKAVFAVSDKGELRAIDTTKGRVTATADVQFKLDGEVKVAVARTGDRVAVGTPDGKVFLYSADTLDPLFSQDLEDSVQAVAFTADGNRLVVACFTGEIHLYDVTKPRRANHRSFKIDDVPEHMAVAADGKNLYVGVWGGGMLACDLAEKPANRVLWRWKVPGKAER